MAIGSNPLSSTRKSAQLDVISPVCAPVCSPFKGQVRRTHEFGFLHDAARDRLDRRPRLLRGRIARPHYHAGAIVGVCELRPVSQIACMMIARRRARATRALRIVDRLAIAKAQSLSLSWPL